MSHAARFRPEKTLLLVAFTTAFAAVIVLPVCAIIKEVLLGQGFAATMFDPLVVAVLKATVGQAASSTGLAILFGFPLGLWLASSSQRRSLSLSQRLLALPFGIPTLVAVTAWVVIFGRQGFLASHGFEIDILYSWTMVVFAHVFFNIPYVALLVSESRSQVSELCVENLRTLGANDWQVFRLLILPSCKTSLLSAGIQVFNLCTMSFVIVLILGGGPPVATMETAIYERLRLGTFDLTSAAACALWQLVLNVAPAAYLARRLGRGTIRVNQPHQEISRPWHVRHVLALIICGAFILPYFSFLDGLTAQAVDTMPWSDLGPSILKTLQLAFLTSLGSLTLALLAVTTIHTHRSHPRLARTLLTVSSIPAGISALVLGVGVWLAYGEWIDPFSGNIFLIAVIQATLFFPLVFRMLFANLSSYQERPMELARCLGASPIQAFYLAEWPRWRRPLIAACSIALGASVAEVSAVALFAGGEPSPLPLVIQRLLSQYRFAEARWATALLFFLAMTVMLLASRHNIGGSSRD